MGMGNYAQFADTVEDDFVKQQCFEGYAKLMSCFNGDIDFLAFAAIFDPYRGEEIPIEWNEEDAEKIEQAYKELQKQFLAQTGLELYIRYHNAEDRGDEVDGGFWEVNGVYAPTPAGKKYKENIVRKFWTVFG